MQLATSNSNPDYLRIQIDSMMKRIKDGTNNRYKCTRCGKRARDRTDMSKHIETHLEGLSYPCDQCGKISRSSHALRYHIYTYHTSK